ncbi:MAG: porin family protein [Acidobacteriota bacterium]
MSVDRRAPHRSLTVLVDACRRPLFVLVLFLALVASPAAADGTLKLVGGFGTVDEGSDLSIDDPRLADAVDSSYDLGFRFGLAYTWAFTDRFGLELEYLYSTNDLDSVELADGQVFEDGNYASVTISANGRWTLRPEAAWRPYLGAGIAWVQEVDIDFERANEEISFETDDVGFQIFAGVERDVGDRWTLDVQLRWLSVSGLEMEAEERFGGTVEADYEPLSLLVGVGWRF